MTEMICDRETDCRKRYVVKLSDEERGWLNTLIRFDIHRGQNEMPERGSAVSPFGSLTENSGTSTPSGRFLFNILGPLSQMEREIVVRPGLIDGSVLDRQAGACIAFNAAPTSSTSLERSRTDVPAPSATGTTSLNCLTTPRLKTRGKPARSLAWACRGTVPA
jgi:hypothetical protein